MSDPREFFASNRRGFRMGRTSYKRETVPLPEPPPPERVYKGRTIKPGRKGHDTRMVRQYLASLQPSMTTEEANELRDLEARVAQAGALERVFLMERIIELRSDVKRQQIDDWRDDIHSELSEYEQRVAGPLRRYGKRHGISYVAWRAVGVPRRVLHEANIHRGS